MKILNAALVAAIALSATGVAVSAAQAAPHMRRVCTMVRGPHHHMTKRCVMHRY